MKLYSWQPSGHGELSFFVMAESEAQAIKCVESAIARTKAPCDGWGTDYYVLTVSDVGVVVTNENE